MTLTTTTAYDADNRPTTVTDPLGRATALTYDAAGNRATLAYPNGAVTRYAYDTLNRVTNLTTAAGAQNIASFAYTLDAAGRRTALAEGDGTLRRYGYDGIDRLTSEQVTGALSYGKTFAYDAVGNRLTQVTTGAGAGTATYAYDARDRMTSDGAAAYTYDRNGNVTAKSGEATYSWDFENRLTQVSMTGDGTVSHVYDVDGNRVKTTVTPSGGAAAVTNMVVDASASGGLSHVVAETDGTGALTALHVRVGDELLAVVRPASGNTWTTRYVHQDALGSVRALTDESGVIADTRAYEAFGTKNSEAGSDPLAYGFAGEPLEATSKLAYHRARWMDSRVGRFAGMDRVDGRDQAPTTWHRYIYAGDEPVLNIDPSGRQYDMVALSAAVVITGILSMSGSTGVPQVRPGGHELPRVELRAHPVFGVGALGDHLYIRWTSKSGARTIYEGGPTDFTWSGVNEDDLGALSFGGKAWNDEHSELDAAVVLREGAEAVGLGPESSGELGCLYNESKNVNDLHVRYRAAGPNSNSGAHTVCERCGLHVTMLPTDWAPGWDVLLNP